MKYNNTISGQLFGTHYVLRPITQKAAIKLFNEGKEIFMHASKMRPFNAWNTTHSVVKSEDITDLNTIINSFSYYNCTRETGKGIKFYVEVK